MTWKPIESAPRDGTKVDLWAKCWRAATDDFAYARFADCWWSNGDTMTGRKRMWFGLDEHWHATHWMPLPAPPEAP